MLPVGAIRLPDAAPSIETRGRAASVAVGVWAWAAIERTGEARSDEGGGVGVHHLGREGKGKAGVV